MAQATQDLVIRMKTDSQNFNDGIEKAKGKVKDFKKNGEGAMNGFTSAIGVATKAFAALGLAVGAKNLFMNFVTSTESMGDVFRNEVGAMKDGWKDFLWQVNTANFSGFDNLISKARKAREELDALGDASSLFDLSTSKLSTEMDDLLNTIQKKKKKGEDYSGEVEQYNELLKEYKKSGQLKKDKTLSSLQSLFDRKGFNLADMGLGGKGIEGYYDLAITAREAAAGVYNDIIKEYREARDKTATGDIKQEGDWVYSEQHDYLAELQKEKGFAWVERARILSDLADITTEEKNKIDALIKDYYATDSAIIQRDRKLNRYLENEVKSSGGGTTSNIQKTELIIEKPELLKALQPIGTENTQIQIYPNAAQPLDEDWLNNEMAEYELQMLELTEKWQERIEVMNVYASALGNVTNMFSNLASIASDDSPWKKLMTILGSVASNIMSLVQTYTSLVAVESVAQAIESGKGIPFPYNLIAIAAAGAAITGLIATIASQAKSQHFAQGGIVGGNDYHDGIRANLSTGEMVLNKNQQTRLWNLIMAGGRGQKTENVVFKIAGEDLVGVMDNYNKNSNY